MTAYLPPNLLALFEPRPPLEHIDLPEKRKLPPYTGIGSLVSNFEDPKTVDFSVFKPIEQKAEKKARIQKYREEKLAKLIAKRKEKWDPFKDEEKRTSNPYKTLFVCRLSYDTTAETLRDAYEEYGPIRRVVLVKKPDGKPKGYAFIEFERERDMKAAFKLGDAKKIDGRRVLVDVERGRTVENWRPRMLGGGRGGTRIGPPAMNQTHDGRSPPRRSYGNRGYGGRPGGYGDGGGYRGGGPPRYDDRRSDRQYDRRDDRRGGGYGGGRDRRDSFRDRDGRDDRRDRRY